MIRSTSGLKVLQINTLFPPHRFGGAEVFLERFAGELVGRGHQVRVACLSPTPTRHGDDRLQVHEFHLRNVYWPFDGVAHPRWKKAVWHFRNSFGRGGAADIQQLLEQEQPDLVHTHNLSGFTSTVWQTVRAQNIPLVHTIHDYALLCPSTTMFRGETNCAGQCLGCRVLSWPKAGHSQAVDAVVGVSQFALDRHLRCGYFSQATYHVVHNGDPRGTTGCHEVNDQQCPEQQCSNDSRPLRVGYLGRLASSKGVELMLEALTPLVPGECELRIGGSGDASYESVLKDRFASRGVQFRGHVDAKKFLAEIDVLVVPSLWHEPFGLVLCEAMTSGVPIVASRVGGIPEVVQDGRCGLLFDPGDVRTLQGHVRRLASDRPLLRAMSEACRALGADYAFENTVDQYLHVYQQTIARKNPAFQQTPRTPSAELTASAP